MDVAFTGTRIGWSTAVGPNFGVARVLVDGVDYGTVDLYAEELGYRRTAWESPRLTNGTHTLTIEWTGVKNPLSGGTYVGVDSLEITGPLPAPRASLLTVASAQLGKPYVWAGSGPDVFDCSGLTRYVYRVAQGAYIPHYSKYQWNLCSPKYARWQDLLPGDLVFATDPSNIHHVGMYIGNGMTINAPATGRNVEFRPVTRYGAFGRVPTSYWKASAVSHILPQ